MDNHMKSMKAHCVPNSSLRKAVFAFNSETEQTTKYEGGEAKLGTQKARDGRLGLPYLICTKSWTYSAFPTPV